MLLTSGDHVTSSCRVRFEIGTPSQRASRACLPILRVGTNSHARAHREGLTASSPDEDIRLAGIIKLYNFFQNGQWNSSNNFNRTNLSYCFVESELPSECLCRHFRPIIPHLMTILDGIEEAESAKAEAEARNRQSKPVVPLKSIPLGDLAIAMRNPKFGLKMQTRRWNVRSFDYTFTGSEFVDWLQTIFIEVREDRQASLGDCKQLLSKHFFRALGSDRSFSDSPTAYYQLAAPFRPNKSTNWFDSSSIPKGASKGQETLNGPVMIGEPQYTRPMADHKEDQLVIKMVCSPCSHRLRTALTRCCSLMP